MELKIALPLLRQNFDLEINNTLTLNESENQAVFACYDRAVTQTLLSMLDGRTLAPATATKPVKLGGPKPGSQAARDRAAKAQETRKRNREAAEQEEKDRLGRVEGANGKESVESGGAA